MTTRRILLVASAIAAISLPARAGAWAETSFANDVALDWVAKFERNGTALFVRRTLERVLTEGYVDSLDAEAAIAAAETVAFSLGKPSPDLPVRLVVRCNSMKQDLALLASVARKSVGRVSGPNSELASAWSANPGALARWQAAIRNLLVRLASNAA